MKPYNTKSPLAEIQNKREKVAEAERLLAIAEHLQEILPEDTRIAHIFPRGGDAGEAASVKIVVDHRREVVPLAAVLTPLPLARARGTFLHFTPAEQMTEAWRAKRDIKEVTEDILPVTWRFAKYADSHPDGGEAYCSWFARINDLLVRVDCVIDQDPAGVEYGYERKLSADTGREVSVRVFKGIHGMPKTATSRSGWWGSDKTYVLFGADDSLESALA